MKILMQHWGLALACVTAAILSAVAPLLIHDLQDDGHTATGRIRTFEAGKSISLEIAHELRAFVVTPETQVEGDPVVGKSVDVWEREGTAKKVLVKD